MRRTTPLILVLCLALLSVAPVQDATAGTASPDTVRTNLWMARALMQDILRETFTAIPRSAHGLLLVPRGTHEARDLMEITAFDMAQGRDLEVFIADDMDTELAATSADYELVFRLEDARLSYPRTGRRFGLWRTWVDRELEVAAVVTVRELASGRILKDERLVRTFGDRIRAGDHHDLATPAYEFTRAGLADGGLHSILEEVVVLGALAGLVTVYFATTAD